MGKIGKDIIEIDVDKLVHMLNASFCEEWLSYYQYWINSHIMEGPMRSEIEKEFLVHANQELNHAEMIVERIIQLGGKPVSNPYEWFKFSGCSYEIPVDRYIEIVLKQKLNEERCAIQRYKEIADYTYGKDHTSHQLLTTILNEEIEHEQEIEDWLNDISRMKEEFRNIRR